MANFSSLKNVPDLFQPQNLDKAGQFLRQPLALAVLASVGAHVLLAVTLPMWSASGEKQPDTRSVAVVELSPLEQARLPQTALSQPLSPLPKTTHRSGKAKPADSLGTVGIPETPTGSSSPDATALYSIPEPPTVAPFSGLSATSSLPKRSTPKSVEPSQEAEKKSTETKKDEAQQDTSPGTSKDDAASNAPSTQARDLAGKSPEDLGKGQEAEAQKLASLFAFNAENTSQEDFNKNAVNFSTYALDLSQGDLQEDWKKLDAVKAPYPKQACQFKHKDEAVQGEPWFGVIVKPDGTIAAQPMLLKSSGFKGLDEAAKEFVAKQKFEPGKKYQGLYFPVKLTPSASDCTATTPDKPAS